MPKANQLVRVICEATEAPAAPGRAMVIRWGDNRRVHDGQIQIIDDESAQEVIRELNSRGVDVVIDYEHTSEGGEFARADRLAPAAGWMKRGSFEAVPGEGIYARIEWTATAARMIANKEYRYLSPVVFKDPVTHKVRVLDKVGLTNTPAIRDFPALINSGAGGQPAESEHGRMDALLNYLRSKLGLAEDATPEDVLAALQGQEAQTVANKAAAEVLLKVANAAKTHSAAIATALAANDTAALGTELATLVNRAATGSAGVPAERYAQLVEEVQRLRDAHRNEAYERLLNKHPGKIDSTDTWFRSIYDADPAQAEKILNGMPKKVATESTTPAGGGQPGGERVALINKARAAYTSAGNQAFSMKSVVNGMLRDANQPPLTDDEIKTHQITAGV